MSIKPKTLPILLTLGVCVCGETESPADRNKAKHTQDRFGETWCATNRERETSKERQGEPKTHSRQMEKPASPQAAL